MDNSADGDPVVKYNYWNDTTIWTNRSAYWHIADTWIGNVPTQKWDEDTTAFNFGDLYGIIRGGHMASFNPSTTIPLTTRACQYGGTKNCTAVCTTPSLLYGNVSMNDAIGANATVQMSEVTFANILACMYYPLISQWLVSNRLGQPEKAALEIIAHDYGILPNASIKLVHSIIDAQTGCYMSYCDQMDGTDTPCQGYSWSDYNNTWVTTYPGTLAPGILDMFPDWSTISSDSNMTINTDIGGIGVSIGYLIQFTLLMLGWLYLRSLRFLKYIIKDNKQPRTWPFSSMSLPEWVRPSVDVSYCIFDEVQTTVMRLLRDFQKAQCFFLIPLNIALILGVKGQNSMFSIATIGQLKRNLVYMQCVALGSIVFATSNIYFLFTGVRRSEELKEAERKNLSLSEDDAAQKKAILSRFRLMILTVVTFVISTVAWYETAHVSNLTQNITPVQSPIDTDWGYHCGLVSPATYNGERWTGRDDAQHPRLGLFAPVIGSLILLGLSAEILLDWRLQQRKEFGRKIFNGWDIHTICKFCTKALLPLIEIAVLASLGLYLTNYMQFMRPTLSTVDKTFTMGQLLAISAWSATICDALVKMPHATMRGYKRAQNSAYTKLAASPDENDDKKSIPLIQVKEDIAV